MCAGCARRMVPLLSEVPCRGGLSVTGGRKDGVLGGLPTASAVMPNLRKSRSPSAEAPKWSIETLRPASPTYLYQGIATPASTETLALTGGGEHTLAVVVVLLEPLHAGHGDHPGRDVFGRQTILRRQRQLHLGAGGDDQHLGVVETSERT